MPAAWARVRPHTVSAEPLVPIGEYPILEIIIRQLVKSGITRRAINHRASLVRAFFGDGSTWGAEVDYFAGDRAARTIAPLASLRICRSSSC